MKVFKFQAFINKALLLLDFSASNTLYIYHIEMLFLIQYIILIKYENI